MTGADAAAWEKLTSRNSTSGLSGTSGIWARMDHRQDLPDEHDTEQSPERFLLDLVNPVNPVLVFSNRQEKIAAKPLLAVKPGAIVDESRFNCQPRDVVAIILVRVLGMNLFALSKLDFHLQPAN